MLRILPVILLFCLPCLHSSTATARDSRVDSLLTVIDRARGQAIEGVWRMTASAESVLAITARAGSAGTYDVWLLDSPDYRIEPCQLIGSAREGAERGSYDLTLTERPGAVRARKRSFIATVDGDDHGRLRLHAYNRGKRISLWRWLPYLFRVTIINQSDRPSDHDGMVRIYPAAGGRLEL